MQAGPQQLEPAKRDQALEVPLLRSPSASLEMANVQAISEKLNRKVQESKSACQLVQEAFQAQRRRDSELEK